MSFFRAVRLLNICAKYKLDEVIPSSSARKFIKISTWLLPSAWVGVKKPRAERLRLALEAAGPIFIKFGQILSTRRDLLPDDIADELVKLQDRVPEFSSEAAISVIETAFGKPLSAIFKTFSEKPLASASIAQVHAAVLSNGDEVVVKVVSAKFCELNPVDVATVIKRS